MTKSKLLNINSHEEFNKAISDPTYKASIVDFTAKWCGPCKRIGPVFEDFSALYTKVQFLKVDVDELASVSAEAGVRAMPTFCVYQNATKVEQLVGPNDKALEMLIKKYNGEDGMKTNKLENTNEAKRSDCNIL